MVATVQRLCQENACEDRVELMIARVRAELEKDVQQRPSWQKQILKDIGRNDFSAARPSLAAPRLGKAGAGAGAGPRAHGTAGGRRAPAQRVAQARAAPVAMASATADQPLRLRCGRETVVIDPGMSAASFRASVLAMMEAKGDVEGANAVMRSVQRQLDRGMQTYPRWVQLLALELGRF